MSDPTNDAKAQLEALAAKGRQLQEERQKKGETEAKLAKDAEMAAKDAKETEAQKTEREKARERLNHALGWSETKTILVLFGLALLFVVLFVSTDQNFMTAPWVVWLSRGILLVGFVGVVFYVLRLAKTLPSDNLRKLLEQPWRTEGAKEILSSEPSSGVLQLKISWAGQSPEKTLLEGLLSAADLKGCSVAVNGEDLVISSTNMFDPTQEQLARQLAGSPIYTWMVEANKMLQALHQGYPIKSVSYSFNKS